MNGGLQRVVCAGVRTEGFQRFEPDRLLRRNLSVELARGQHIERPLSYVERVDMFAVLTLEQTEDVHIGASLRTGRIGVGAGVPALCGADAERGL